VVIASIFTQNIYSNINLKFLARNRGLHARENYVNICDGKCIIKRYKTLKLWCKEYRNYCWGTKTSYQRAEYWKMFTAGMVSIEGMELEA